MVYEQTGQSTTAAAPIAGRGPAAGGFEVLVAHDDEVVRCGLRSMLDSLECIRSVRAVDTAQVRGRLVGRLPEVLLLAPPGETGPLPQLLSEAQGRGTKIVLLLSGSEDVEHVRGYLRADGFLCEPGLTADGLVHAFAQLRRGEIPMPANVMRELLSRASPQRPYRLAHLTAREMEVLRLLAEGMSNKQIARKLSISEHGAKRHVANVLAKMNCPNRTLAVAVAMREGLLAET